MHGIKTIILGKGAIQIFWEHQVKQGVERQAWRTKGKDHGLVFTSPDGKPLRDHQFYPSFKQLIQEGRLPNIRFHDLRHTAASLMLNFGIPVIIVSKRLGHARPSITLDIYGHLIPSKQEEAAMLMDNLMVSSDKSGCTISAWGD
jgi:integrase